VISDFRRDVDENCALLGCYAALTGNYVPTFQDNLSVPSSRVKTNRLSRNVETELPLYVANISQKSTERKLFESSTKVYLAFLGHDSVTRQSVSRT
jgi:hypothetical protein